MCCLLRIIRILCSVTFRCHISPSCSVQVPLHPVTPATSLADCEAAAANIAARLVAAVPGWSCFIFGPGEGRGLAERRREVGWWADKNIKHLDNKYIDDDSRFKSEVAPGVSPDLGTYHPARGLAGVGAAPYMSNFNISLATADPVLASRVLAAVRARCGGLPGVAAMAFPRQHGTTEVACNVDMFRCVQCAVQWWFFLNANLQQHFLYESLRDFYSKICHQICHYHCICCKILPHFNVRTISFL